MNTDTARLKTILDQTLDCIFTFDQETLLFNYVNQGAMLQTGYSEEELYQMTPLAIKPEFDEEAFRKLLAPLLDGTKESLLFQTVHQHKEGALIPVEICLQHVSTPDAPSFVAIVRDISKRKEAEEALRASEARFKAVINDAPVGIFQCDPEGNCIYVNERWCQITGITFEQALGNGWISALHPEDTEAVASHWQDFVDNDANFSFEYRFLSPQSKKVSHVSGHAVPLLDQDDSLMSYIGTVVDISERVQLEEQRRQMESKLQDTQKLESLGLLAGGIAHDFNNVLTAIMGSASLASIELSSGSPIQEHLSRINAGSVQAADLCKQLLAYSGKGKFIVKNLSLNHIIDETLHLLKISISKKSVLACDLYQEIPAIEADPTQIRQILMNLVINASEAIGDTSGVINVCTGLTRVNSDYLKGTIIADELPEGTYASLEVSDTGSGMSPEVLKSIFDPFFTTKFTGRGLGLAAVIGIVRGHKGTIKVYSEAGRGTTFKLLFPIVDGEAEMASVKPARKVLPRERGCVLIVDDEESIRTTLAQMVQKMGFSLELAPDGRAAVEVFRKNHSKYVAVLMDLTMPHMNGEAAFSEMKKLDANVPVVLMSGFNEERASARFQGKGLAGFMEKPFSFSALEEILDEVSVKWPKLQLGSQRNG